jgi:hypothetical protein
MRIGNRLSRLEQSVAPKEANRRPQNDAEWLEVFAALPTAEKVAMLRSPVWAPAWAKGEDELCGLPTG